MEQVIGKLEAQIEAFAKERENYCSELQNLVLTVEKTSWELSEGKAENMTVLKNNKTLEKNLENKVSENQITLKSLKNLTGENQNLRSDSQSAAKNIKLKEKEIYRLEKVVDNATAASNKLKVNINELIAELKKLEKASRILKKKTRKPLKVLLHRHPLLLQSLTTEVTFLKSSTPSTKPSTPPE